MTASMAPSPRKRVAFLPTNGFRREVFKVIVGFDSDVHSRHHEFKLSVRFSSVEWDRLEDLSSSASNGSRPGELADRIATGTSRSDW
jgi:hypothetical protein